MPGEADTNLNDFLASLQSPVSFTAHHFSVGTPI